MPKFSASLSFLFADLPFLDRFAAAKAGFAGVECASPYEHDAKDVARRYLDGVCRNVTTVTARRGGLCLRKCDGGDTVR
jgi:hydroxypyruvate isomerase